MGPAIQPAVPAVVCSPPRKPSHMVSLESVVSGQGMGLRISATTSERLATEARGSKSVTSANSPRGRLPPSLLTRAWISLA